MTTGVEPEARGLRTARAADLAPLGLGVAALALGTAFGWDARLVDAVVSPPAIVRAVLVALAVVAGGGLLVGGLRRIGASSRAGGSPTVVSAAPDLPRMVRGIRLVFLGIAAFAAAAGWLMGHPLPLVVALIVAGVDVLETSFLLFVVRRPRGE